VFLNSLARFLIVHSWFLTTFVAEFYVNDIKFSVYIIMFRNLPPVTKNLLIITGILYFADYVFGKYGVNFTQILGLHYFSAADFHFWQPLTYMFMHANFSHIFFNMFAVLMFAPAIEEHWGSKRFLLYYLVTGVGAAIVQEVVWAVQLQPTLSLLDPIIASQLANRAITIGASGAVFGILLAFGWLFPDVRMFIMFIPIPIRARTLVLIYAAVELFAGVLPSAGDNVAHFAHLGGMIFGWVFILWCRYRGYSGFEAPDWDFSRLLDWIKKIWERVRPHKHPRIKRDNNSKDYNDYHYHKPL
jgi:membrane associated rhomboid family serine protease